MSESNGAIAPGKILDLRKALDCTQEEFAKILGITAVALSRWENGKSRPQDRKVKLLEYLDDQLKEGALPPGRLKRILLVGGCRLPVGGITPFSSGQWSAHRGKSRCGTPFPIRPTRGTNPKKGR